MIKAEGVSIFIVAFYGSVLMYILGCVIYYWINDLSFATYSNKLRKTLYFIFFSGISIGILRGYVDYSKWQELVQYMIIAIVIDISVFQTPNITKFGNAEFKHNELIVETISENEKTFFSIENKQNVLLGIMQEIEYYFNSISTVNINNFSDYEKELSKYLNTYTDTFKFGVRIYEFKKDSNDDVVRNDLNLVVSRLFTANSINKSDSKLKKISKHLFEAKIQVINKEIHVIPIFGKTYNFLIELSGKDLILTDTMNVSYLANIFISQKG